MKPDDDPTLPSEPRLAAQRDPEATYSSRPVVSSYEILFSEAGGLPAPPAPPPGSGTGRVTVPPFLKALTPIAWGHRDLSPRRAIGRGGQGEIWEAVQVSLNRTIAVKRLLEPHEAARSAGESAFQKESFVREAKTAARLEHPNIVPVHDLKETDEGAPLLVMKRLEGKPWSEVLEIDRAELPEADFLARHLGVLVAVARAVAFAHEQGVIHRDLKPAQVVLGSFGEVTLLDWGLAASFRASPQGDWIAPPVSTADNPAGTPSYMAPEQTTTSPSGLGPWTDVYLLGGILWFLAAGVRPHEGPGLTEIYGMAGRGEITPPDPRRRPPAHLLEVARVALAPRPEDRPPSRTRRRGASPPRRSGGTTSASRASPRSRSPTPCGGRSCSPPSPRARRAGAASGRSAGSPSRPRASCSPPASSERSSSCGKRSASGRKRRGRRRGRTPSRGSSSRASRGGSRTSVAPTSSSP